MLIQSIPHQINRSFYYVVCTHGVIRFLAKEKGEGGGTIPAHAELCSCGGKASDALVPQLGHWS